MHVWTFIPKKSRLLSERAVGTHVWSQHSLKSLRSRAHQQFQAHPTCRHVFMSARLGRLACHMLNNLQYTPMGMWDCSSFTLWLCAHEGTVGAMQKFVTVNRNWPFDRGVTAARLSRAATRIKRKPWVQDHKPVHVVGCNSDRLCLSGER